MKIRFSKRDVWWVVVRDRDKQISTYSFVYPMVYWWLQDQVGVPLPPSILKYILMYNRTG